MTARTGAKRGSYNKIDPKLRLTLIYDYERCKNMSSVARKHNLSESTVRYIVRKHQKDGSIRKSPTRNRSKKLNSRQLDYVSLTVKRNPFFSLRQILQDVTSALQIKISTSTLHSYLFHLGFTTRIRIGKPMLSPRHVAARLLFWAVHQARTMEYWSRVVFSDESKFQPRSSSGRRYVRLSKGITKSPLLFKPTVKFGGGTLMVWGAISYWGVGPLYLISGNLNSDGYVHILESTMLPFFTALQEEHGDMIFQQDNDPKHTSRKAKAWFAERHIDLMAWPAMSPDLNIIEHVWYQVAHRLDQKERSFSSIPKLWAALQEIWGSIPLDAIRTLYHSIPNRLQELHRVRGHNTRY